MVSNSSFFKLCRKYWTVWQNDRYYKIYYHIYHMTFSWSNRIRTVCYTIRSQLLSTDNIMWLILTLLPMIVSRLIPEPNITYTAKCDDFWAINILCILAVFDCVHSTWEKRNNAWMEWQFWPICSFYCMLCCSDSESKLCMHVSFWITSCEINFYWVTSVSFVKFFKNLWTVWC